MSEMKNYTCQVCGKPIAKYGLCSECDNARARRAVSDLQKRVDSVVDPFEKTENAKMDPYAPIILFNSQEQLEECLDWWQDRLFLHDWTIKATLCKEKDFVDQGNLGENIFVFEHKEAIIHILDASEFPETHFKICHEQILVHELLHCLYNFIADGSGSYEGKYLDAMEHQRLESMARSLILVKYGLEPDWFKRND